MVDKEFIEELFTLCKKYKKNINVKIEEYDSDEISAYDVDIHGAWEIRNDCEAVVVHAIPQPQFLYNIKGEKEI